jgi:hypothetical protein
VMSLCNTSSKTTKSKKQPRSLFSNLSIFTTRTTQSIPKPEKRSKTSQRSWKPFTS